MSRYSKYFQNHRCEYFPCHSVSGDFFNCLFCYCPLYLLEDCGGGYTYTAAGIKDCSACLIPHKEGGYAYVLSKLNAAVTGKEAQKDQGGPHDA